jgi:D-isomer specific 2-hydroxyacid dehydrogenase, catalytic domain
MADLPLPRPAVLVTRLIFADVVERLRGEFDVETNADDRVLSKAELIDRLQGKAGALITGTEPIDEQVLKAVPQLRAVCSMAVGYNNIDLDACTAHGVLATNAPDVLTETTADFGFALMPPRGASPKANTICAAAAGSAGRTICWPAAMCTAARSASWAWAASASRSRAAGRWASA